MVKLRLSTRNIHIECVHKTSANKMLMNFHTDWKRKGRPLSNNKSQSHYTYMKWSTFKIHLIIQLFIMTSVMASPSPDPSVNILNDRINIYEPVANFIKTIQPKTLDDQMFLNEHHPLSSTSNQLNNNDNEWSMRLTSVAKPVQIITQLTIGTDKSKNTLPNINNRLSCICINQKSSCWRMCGQNQFTKRQHKRFTNRMHNRNNSNGNNALNELDYVKSSTLIFGKIKNGIRPKQHDALIQSSALRTTFHEKPHNRAIQSQLNNANPIIHNRNTPEARKYSRNHAWFRAHKTTNHSEIRMENAKTIDGNDDHIVADKIITINGQINDSTRNLRFFKRKIRSIVPTMSLNQRDLMYSMDATMASAKSQMSEKAVNSVKSMGNESIGMIFDANGTTISTALSKYIIIL